MVNFKTPFTLVLLFFISVFTLKSQVKHHYQTDFSVENFKERRAKIYIEIGNDAIAIIQGSAGIPGFSVFRQTNTFYYLCGLETSHSYLLLNGKTKTTSIYLPHRDEGREKGEGKVLSAEDAELIKELTGVDNVFGIEFLSRDIVRTGLIKPPSATIYTPLSPAETGNDSRDELLFAQARTAADPWDDATSREAKFAQKIKSDFPSVIIKDLSPVLDQMRLIKSKEEVNLIRQATQIAGLGIIEAMRSTEPGIYEYQLDAAAKYIYYVNGSRGDGYASIIGGGTNAYYGHYFHKKDVLKDGDLVLMDYAPDYRYYTSDVTRIWPVNGKFDKEQTELYNFIIAYRDALFRYIKPGVTSGEVLEKAAAEMKQYIVGKKFVKPSHLKAVQEGLVFKGHFQHPVGMAVHDVARVRGTVKLKPGMVFTIDPMIWLRDERLYIRIEDVVLVTETGAENMSAFVPTTIKEVEKTIKEKGLTEFNPPVTLPFKDK
ncbi:aminopeptidase P N-terminal domain-containing protein [Polaribacter sp. Asnod1-A03]|uniref:aminopeptidase P N-terminal domain-containing protein n=1 Tax=Polaribacter sp. Asnod1-A03 TaxID=3160581 RepID=UPI0038663D7A